MTDAAAPLNVLVVDDEPMVMRAELRVLESAGHVCFGARSAAEAIATPRREPIDVVVSDLRVRRRWDRARACDASQPHRSHPQVPLIMVTGVADFSSVNAARSTGAVDYIVQDGAARRTRRRCAPRCAKTPTPC